MQSIINGIESCYDQTWNLRKHLETLIPMEALSLKHDRITAATSTVHYVVYYLPQFLSFEFYSDIRFLHLEILNPKKHP